MKTTGIIGILALLSFGIGFGILFLIINPGIYSKLNDGLFIAGYNSPILHEDNFTRYFTYLFTGILIVIFCIRLIIQDNSQSLCLIGKILLLISGILWASFGIFELSAKSNISMISFIIRLLLTLTLSSFGFIFIAIDFKKIIHSTKIKWFLLGIGILIPLNTILDFSLIKNYPVILGGFSWLLYFIGIGYIGLTLLTKASTQQKLISNAG